MAARILKRPALLSTPFAGDRSAFNSGRRERPGRPATHLECTGETTRVTWAYLHLISHSFPIVLFVTGTLVGIAGWIAGRDELERWGLLAFLVGGAFVIPAYLTGLAAADVVADRTFVRPSAIQRHRTWATFAAVPLLVAAILAGFSFAEPRDRRLRRFVIVMGAFAAVATGFAATLGARIEHGEERPDEAEGVIRIDAAPSAAPVYPGERKDHDAPHRLDERIGSDVRQHSHALDAHARGPHALDPHAFVHALDPHARDPGAPAAGAARSRAPVRAPPRAPRSGAGGR